ncbi:TipAS antibiotic-recognition domain-containing protein [Actinomadura sp. 6N118]|uniref:TipAS antibiotic-recognition domain-containing protein n=1 Tax=Actinomadura sp. 6N118 TaxID=3375151 RepID=UPI0037B1B6F5
MSGKPAWVEVEDAEDRWGGTAQWAQYAEQASRMTPADWKEIAAGTEALNTDFAATKKAEISPGFAEANALAERHRAFLSRYFDCTYSTQVCIARMSVDDPRFVAYYDAIVPGLTT